MANRPKQRARIGGLRGGRGCISDSERGQVLRLFKRFRARLCRLRTRESRRLGSCRAVKLRPMPTPLIRRWGRMFPPQSYSSMDSLPDRSAASRTLWIKNKKPRGIQRMNKKLFAAAAIGLCATLGLPLSAQAAIEEGKLVVWINGDKGYKGLAKVGEEFTAEPGIPAEVAHPDAATDKFQQAAATGNGPDIFIWAPDRLGEWAQSGLIPPINPSAASKDAIADFAWDAVSYDGKLWGYPMAVEAPALIYNKALVPTPPASFDEVFAIHEKLDEIGRAHV